MNKVTYLFGAGASANALPVVEGMPARIAELIDFLSKAENQLEDSSFQNLPKTKKEYQTELIDLLRWMHTESANHASVDTFAKKLTIKSEYRHLRKLKIAMSIFFIFEQIRNKIDKRYDTFYASILSFRSRFPENIRILSWNYDYQFELAYHLISDNPSIVNNQAALNVKNKFQLNRYDRGFGIYKLNGTTGLYANDGRAHYGFYDNIVTQVDKKTIEQITFQFGNVIENEKYESSLSFAWEDGWRGENSIVFQAQNATIDTSALVVIGYSFPFFNREIDKAILNNMENLKRVYFQAPDADALEERFLALRNDVKGVELIKRFDTKQFLLPNEL